MPKNLKKLTPIEEQLGETKEKTKPSNSSSVERYYSAKVVVKELERYNNSKLILIESANSKDGEWHKLFGHSALFYVYDVALRLGKSDPKMRPDSDVREHIKGGYASVRFIEKFIADMAKIGFKEYEHNKELGMYIFDLGKKYSAQELKEFCHQSQEQTKQLNHLARPKDDYPEIWYAMLQLANFLPPKIKYMPEVYRETLGFPLIEDLRQLFVVYVNMANGKLEKPEAKRQMLVAVNNMLAGLMIISEVEKIHPKDIAKVGDILANLKAAISTKVKENKRGEVKPENKEK